MERLELSTIALWEQPSTIEVHQLNTLPDQCWDGEDWTHLWPTTLSTAYQTEEIHPNIADEAGLEPTTTGFGDQCSTYWTTHQFIVAGSGFAPLFSPLWVGQDYYFSNLRNNTKSLITSPYCTQRLFRNDGIKYCKLLDWTSCKSSCGKCRTRTCNLRINSPLLYHWANNPLLVAPIGIEPMTFFL